jgi:hypothetical protein
MLIAFINLFWMEDWTFPIVRLGDRFDCFNKEDSLTLHAKSTWLLGLHYGTNGVHAYM